MAAQRTRDLAKLPQKLIQLMPFYDEFSSHSHDSAAAEQFVLCQFVIDIRRVSVKGLIEMRAILPQQEYRLLKNRKCARESRLRRKEQTLGTLEELQICRKENETLKSRIKFLEQQLSAKESQQ